jgi:hypothetical protein
MSKRYRNFLLATGLWLVTIPMVVAAYFLPALAISLQDVANYAWSTSLVASGAYDTMYIMVVVGTYVTKGMDYD